MIKRAVQGLEEDAPAPYPARPPGSLPSFAKIKMLPRRDRQEPLEAWVVWVNANRGRMNPELERELDETLCELEETVVSSSDFDKFSRRFDEWLESLDDVPKAPTA